MISLADIIHEVNPKYDLNRMKEHPESITVHMFQGAGKPFLRGIIFGSGLGAGVGEVYFQAHGLPPGLGAKVGATACAGVVSTAEALVYSFRAIRYYVKHEIENI